MTTYTKVRPHVPVLGISGEAPPTCSNSQPGLYTVEQLAFQMPAIVELEGSISSALNVSAIVENSVEDDWLKPSDFRSEEVAHLPAGPDGFQSVRIGGRSWAPSPRNRPLLLRSARVSPRVPVPPSVKDQDFAKALHLGPRSESHKASTVASKTKGKRPSTAGPLGRPISAKQRPQCHIVRILGPDDKPEKLQEKQTQVVGQGVEDEDAAILHMYRKYAGTEDDQENGNASKTAPDLRQAFRARVVNLEPDMASKLPAPGVFGAQLQGDSLFPVMPARTTQRPVSARSTDIGSLYRRQMQRTDTNFVAAGEGVPPPHHADEDNAFMMEHWTVDCFGRYRPTIRDSASRVTTGRPALGLDLHPRESRQHASDDIDGGLSLDVSTKPIQPTPRSRQESKSSQVKFADESPSPREHIDLRHLSPRLLNSGENYESLENSGYENAQLADMSAPIAVDASSEPRPSGAHFRSVPERTVTFLSHDQRTEAGSGPWQVRAPCPNCGFQHQTPVLGEYSAQDWNPDTIREQSSGEEAERPDSEMKIDWLTFALSRSGSAAEHGSRSASARSSRAPSAVNSPYKPFSSPIMKASKVRRTASESVSTDKIKMDQDIKRRVDQEVKEQLENETGIAMRRIQQLSVTVTELEAKLQEAEMKMQEREVQHLQDIAGRTKEIQEDANREREKVQENELRIKSLESQLENGEKQLRALRAQRAAKLADWERAALKDGQAKLKADQEDLQERIKKHESDLEAAQSVFQKAQEIQAQAAKLDEDRTSLNDWETGLKRREERLEQEVAALDLKKADLEKEIRLSVGASAYDKSELLKELRLATLANITMKAELETLGGKANSSQP